MSIGILFDRGLNHSSSLKLLNLVFQRCCWRLLKWISRCRLPWHSVQAHARWLQFALSTRRTWVPWAAAFRNILIRQHRSLRPILRNIILIHLFWYIEWLPLEHWLWFGGYYSHTFKIGYIVIQHLLVLHFHHLLEFRSRLLAFEHSQICELRISSHIEIG